MLPTQVLREARTAADTLHRTATATWLHIVSAANGGEMTPRNLVVGTRGANDDMLAWEQQLRVFLANIARWGVQQNYNVQFVINVQYWSDNLAVQVISAAENCERHGNPPAEEVLEAIRGTFSHLLDPYNFGTYEELSRHRR